jgi:hypothetical protein
MYVGTCRLFQTGLGDGRGRCEGGLHDVMFNLLGLDYLCNQPWSAWKHGNRFSIFGNLPPFPFSNGYSTFHVDIYK